MELPYLVGITGMRDNVGSRFGPMAADKKTIKFQMMMSPSEAEALDDWGFANRIRSRAESIRQLIQKGLAYDVAAKRSDLGNQIIRIFLSGKFPSMELIADYIEQGEAEIENLKARNQLARRVSEELLTASILNENPGMDEDKATSIARQHVDSQQPVKQQGEILPNRQSRLELVEEIRKSVRARSDAQPEPESSRSSDPASSQPTESSTGPKRKLNVRKPPSRKPKPSKRP